jgi:hypothetical protein
MQIATPASSSEAPSPPRDSGESKAAEEAGQAVMALLSGKVLKEDSIEGLKVMFEKIKELRIALRKCSKTPGLAEAALSSGQSACRLFCERPALEVRAGDGCKSMG